MAEFYQVATGSKKISNLTVIDGISGSAVIPVVMSNVVGGSYPIINGTTNQISYQDFRESVILNNQNTFTTQQSIITTSGKKITQLTADGITILTGSGLGNVTDGFKVDSIGSGVKLYSYDSTEITPANSFKTFIEVGTGFGNVTLSRNVITTGNLNVAGNLGLGGNVNINQNLIVGGTITAQSYNTEFISASIIYESGSTKFGDTTDDNHERTGSLLVSGSSSVIGNSYVSGIVQNALLGAVTQSLITQNVSQGSINSLNFVVTQSLITQNTSQAGVNTLISAVTTSLLAQTASQGLVNDLTLAVTSSLITQNTSQGGVNLGISIVTASLNAYTASGATSTSNINSFTASQLAVNDLTLAVTSSLITQNTSQGLVNNLTQAVTSSLITQNTSQGLVNNLTQAVTSSLITQNTSQGLVNTLTSAVTQSLINQNTSQGAVNLTISGVTASLINQNTSQGLVNTLTSAVTTSLINQNTSQGLVNNLTQAVTSSLITIVGGLQSYTASLKGAAIVSSSQQITNLGFITSSQSASFNFIGFNTSAGVSVGVGQLAWNNSDGTLDLGMKGGNVVQQIGQEIFYEVRNDTVIQIPNGTAVFASGVTAGSGRITVEPYTADGSVREVRFLGLATENISTGVNGIVTHFGYVRGLDTRGDVVSSIAVGDETWAIGDILYVHPTIAGKLTNVKPEHAITVAIIITRHQSVGVLFVRPSSGGHLEDIHDILINTGSLTNGQVLSYNSTSGLWVNTNKLTGSYGIQGTLELNGDILGNSLLNTFTGSLRSEVNGIEAYTASLKGAAIVSSSQQITNYYKFAETASANTFYGNQTISGSLHITEFAKLTPVVSFPVGQAGMLVASASYGKTNLYVYDGADWKWLVTGSIS